MIFINHLRLLNLQIREIEAQNVDLLGGALRYPNGDWNMNCHQFIVRNYTLQLVPNYFHSTKENCILCDYVSGPILVRTVSLKNFAFDETMKHSDIVFLDFFFQVILSRNHQILYCILYCICNDRILDSLQFRCNKKVWEKVFQNKDYSLHLYFWYLLRPNWSIFRGAVSL